MSLQDQARGLLEVIEAYRRTECRRLLEQAREVTNKLLRQARTEGRTRVRRAIARERERAEASIRTARAALDARRRLSRQHRAQALLETVWPRLEPLLRQRWSHGEGRRAWVEASLEQAIGHLPACDWLIRHPPDWVAAERDALARRVVLRVGRTPCLEADPTLEAGLVIQAGESSLDASLQGLLADRSWVEARFLALLEEVAP